ncbi:MAG: efflux RND transporter periplasmic adaptor subunit [Betaproteobacteria bacterium]|nr:efflux RND transporter periplasmic adaptor subunit [Betaproteobacteria bacterium]MDH5221925.1 efflux RND transporter periplasmic adaptor subunit [Betaproteobacteria bacterium]MDH5349870.1 efflux RND transporter periplasmic adaptor subunit [Betaproteobacteria bacterium]
MATASSRWFWRIVTALILAVGAGGFVALNKLKPKPAVRAPVQQLPLVQAEALEFRSGALTVSGNGLVRPRAEVVVGAEVSGRVSFVSPALVTGGVIKRGQVLVRLDEAPFRAALAQAEAELASARAALRLAEQLLERTRELIAKSYLSQQTLDERMAARDQAAAALERAQALAHQRRLDLERAVVRAPFDGKVLAERVDAGETVQPGKELARIFADGALEIAVSLSDRDMALIADLWRGGTAGAEARVRVSHGNGVYQWPARVDRVEAAVDSATRTFSVVVRVDQPGARGTPLSGDPAAAPPLLLGMYASVDIAGADAGRHALVPRRALRDGGVLWLLGEGNRVSIRPVRVLQDAGERVVVAADGLPAGARVVVTDLKVVTEGLAVREIGAAGRAAP